MTQVYLHFQIKFVSCNNIKDLQKNNQQQTLQIHLKFTLFFYRPFLTFLFLTKSKMGKKKMIENYQVLQIVGQVEDMYEIIKAKHIEQKKYYTLKKVKIKNDKNSQLYEGFLNQASLLKRVKHPNIAKSIKMMKTATSIYVVYDYCQGQNLLQWMENGNKRTLVQKQGIIKQICLVLAELRRNGITHLYLNPQCIYVNESGDIKITDFMYGTDMPDTQQQIKLNWKVPRTQFIAPEIKKGTACFESDLYSFGKIIEFMEPTESKKGNLTLKQFNTKCQQYSSIIKESTRKKPQQRDSLQEVYKIIFKTKGKLKKMKSMSMSMSKIGGKQSILSRTSRISTATNNQGGDFVQDLILKILKRRNMARLLIQIFKNIVDVVYTNSTDLLILVTLILKKSTLILNSIGKYMKYAKGIPGMQLQQKQRNKLFKSADYFKMQPIIDLQVKTQKKLLQSALEAIYLDNVKILQDKRFNQQLKKEELDQNYLRQLMKQFVTNSVKEMQLERQHTNFVKALYVMHMILQNGGIQFLFQKKITLFPIQLNQQPIFVKMHKQMTVQELINQLLKYKT